MTPRPSTSSARIPATSPSGTKAPHRPAPRPAMGKSSRSAHSSQAQSREGKTEPHASSRAEAPEPHQECEKAPLLTEPSPQQPAAHGGRTILGIALGRFSEAQAREIQEYTLQRRHEVHQSLLASGLLDAQGEQGQDSSSDGIRNVANGKSSRFAAISRQCVRLTDEQQVSILSRFTAKLGLLEQQIEFVSIGELADRLERAVGEVREKGGAQ